MRALFYIPDVNLEYYQSTKIDWIRCVCIPNDAKRIHKSKSGSEYYIKEEFLYRKSNHWGHIGNCCWNLFKENGAKLRGRIKNRKQGLGLTYINKHYRIGRCKIDDIKHLAPKAPKRYITNDKGFPIINPEFKEYIKIYKSIT